MRARDPEHDLPDEVDYLAAVEARLAELARAPLVLSTRDWERVRRWRQRGIRLQVVLRSLGDVLGGRQEGEAPERVRSLAYCERAVEQRWKAAREGRVGRPARHAVAPAARLRATLRALAAETSAAARRAALSGSGLAAAAASLRRAAERLRRAARSLPRQGDPLEGVSAAVLEAEAFLRRDLRAALGAEWARREGEERRRLGARLVSMTARAAGATLEAATLAHLRRDLGVPAFDPGALHARLQSAPRARLTRPPSSP
jgi:hypothetical protein